MKKGEFWTLCFLICWYGLYNGIMAKIRHDKLHKEVIELKGEIQKRNHLDSLYWDHLENCSFIHKDSIGVGYQGYLYAK